MEAAMTWGRRALFLAGTALLAVSGGGMTDSARAGGYCSDMALTCENGRTYPLCPIAVSDEGEVVTAQLVLGRGRGLHVRLMPLGIGYRYAGRGVWFDGVRQNATLNFGMHSSVQCTVVKQ
jgi:hypothetical protein